MVEYRSVSSKDKVALCALLRRAGVRFLDLKGRDICGLVVDDAVRKGNVCWVVAVEDSTIAGWSVAVINSRRYWKRLLFRHPLIGLRVVTRRVWKKLRSSGRATDEVRASFAVDWPKRSDCEWGLTAPHVARALDLQVMEGFRRRGIASRMHEELFEMLRSRGVTRVDAYVMSTNEPSIVMHQKEGWAFAGEEDGVLLLTLEI